jgi:hypothetical protein
MLNVGVAAGLSPQPMAAALPMTAPAPKAARVARFMSPPSSL